MCSLVLLRTSPTMMVGFFPVAFAYSLNLSLPSRLATMVSATCRESVSFHRPLRSTASDGFMRVTDRAQPMTRIRKMHGSILPHLPAGEARISLMDTDLLLENS